LKKRVVNVGASIRQRLLNLAKERQEDFGLVLTKFGLERILYRISQSKYQDLFVLKGGLLFEVWTGQRYRPTRDADFLARRGNDLNDWVEIFREVCDLQVEDDGLLFGKDTVKAERITEDADYEGVRVTLTGTLEAAKISIQIDLGFGDLVTPDPAELTLPTLLNLPAPRLLTYPKESVIAEKLEALVSLGIAGSRMKDLHDIKSLSREFDFDGEPLAAALKQTFGRRKTALPEGSPLFLTNEFFEDTEKKRQWAAFCNKNRSYVDPSTLEEICAELARFLLPIMDAAAHETPFHRKWARIDGWK
jgi:hypothetical protein